MGSGTNTLKKPTILREASHADEHVERYLCRLVHPADWSLLRDPGPADDVVINGGEPQLESGDAAFRVSSITLNGGTLAIQDPGKPQSVSGNVSVAGSGSLQLDGRTLAAKEAAPDDRRDADQQQRQQRHRDRQHRHYFGRHSDGEGDRRDHELRRDL